MEAPAPGQQMNSTEVNDESRNSQRQQQEDRVEPMEKQRFQSQSPPIQFGGGNPPSHNSRVPVRGQKRDVYGSAVPSVSSSGLPNSNPAPSQDGKSFVKLFVGFVPRNVTEDDIRPIFAEHGNVLEVALVKDKITGEQRGCCFIRYATIEEADRAIKALDNNYTIPGSTAPITVKYAESKKRRIGSDAPNPVFGRQGFGYGPTGARTVAAPGRGRGKCPPRNAHHMGGEIRGSSSFGNSFQHGNPVTSRWNPLGTLPMVGAMNVPSGQVHGSAWRPAQMAPQMTGPGSSTSTSRGQAFNAAPMQPQSHPYGQQLPQLQQQVQEQVQQQNQHLIQPVPYQSIQYGQPPQSGPPLSFNEQLSVFQPQMSAPPLPHTVNGLQPLRVPATYQMQMQPNAPAEHSVNQAMQIPAIQNHFQSQELCPPLQNQQQSSMQPHYPPVQQHPTHTMAQPQESQIFPSQWHYKQPQQHLDQPKPVPIAMPMPPSNTSQPIAAAAFVVGGGPAPTLTCNWTIHTSPEGMTYYYNRLTGESKWEKPGELTAFEKQKEQPPSQVLQPQMRMQQTCSYPQFQFQPQQLQQSQIIQPVATLGQKPAEPKVFERQQQQPPLQIPQLQSQIQQTQSHPQIQPQQQQPLQILQPYVGKPEQQPGELTIFEQQQKRLRLQILQPQSQIQLPHSHPQFQPQQQHQSQILQPSVGKPGTVPAIAPTKVAEPITATVTTVADSRTSSHPPLTCNWNEHTSTDGHKYYYNEVTGVSQWEKPAELTAFENQQASRPQPESLPKE